MTFNALSQTVKHQCGEADKEELGDENEVDLELMAWCRSEAGMTCLPSSLGNKSNSAVNNGIAKEDQVEVMGECDMLEYSINTIPYCVHCSASGAHAFTLCYFLRHLTMKGYQT